MTPARAAGIFFLITHVTSVGAVLFYAASPDLVLLGTLLDVILAVTVVGTGVALYPIVRRESEAFALGYAALRTLEAGVILVGVVAMMAGMVGLYEKTFIVGPGFICAFNTVTLAWILYRSRLVPRFIPILGLIGGPVIFLVNLAKVFDVFDSIPGIGVLVVPIFAWEICLAVYLIAKGPRDVSRRGLV